MEDKLIPVSKILEFANELDKNSDKISEEYYADDRGEGRAKGISDAADKLRDFVRRCIEPLCYACDGTGVRAGTTLICMTCFGFKHHPPKGKPDAKTE